MTRGVRRLLAPLALLAALLAAGDARAATQPSVVRVTVDRDGPGHAAPVVLRLTCRTGSRRPGCRALRRVPRAAFAPPDPGVLCTQEYGGPETARVTGRIGGRRVDAAFHRHDGCGIARWELAAPLLDLAS